MEQIRQIIKGNHWLMAPQISKPLISIIRLSNSPVIYRTSAAYIQPCIETLTSFPKSAKEDTPSKIFTKIPEPWFLRQTKI